MALVDLWFAEDKIKRGYDCSLCSKNPLVAKERKCEQPGFAVFQKPRRIDEFSLEYSFCPGKATWYSESVNLFKMCRVAMETGILKEDGSLDDQDESFVEVFPDFVQRWKDRQYHKIWQDVRQFTKQVLEAVLGKK